MQTSQDFDHHKCSRIRLVGSCGALAECEHGGAKVRTEWRHLASPVLEVTPERETELRETVGACIG